MRKVVLVTLLLVMGCGSSEEGTSLLSQQGPPASGADRAPATTIPKVAPCPDNDVACCEEQLGVESTDCLEVLVELGHCRTVSIPDGSACDSGTVCGVEATCQNGACNVPEEGTDCAALEVGPCALATCNDETGECDIYPLSDGTECGDGDSCNGLDVCLGGSCQSIPSPDCNDGNPCTVDTCAPESGCIQTPAEGESCSDDNVCTQNDTCDAAGLCIPGQPVCPCTEAEDCQGKAGLCDSPLVCINEQCTPDPKTPPVVCNDGNPCTNDACDEATGDCVYTNNENPCTDGNPCTEEDRCEEGSCTGTSKICDDGDPCTTDETCDLATGLCTEGVYSCQSCSDASECPPLPACGGQFECVDEVCKLIEGSALNCSELPTAPCTVNSCDDASGTCKQTSLADGTPCDDGNLCTTFDACSSGACVPGPAEDCDDKNDCTVDACSPDVGCTTTAQSGASCSDNNLCTLADTCLNGECEGAAAIDCTDENPCTTHSCDPSIGCLYGVDVGASCEDGDSCTSGETCSGVGVCEGGTNTCGACSDASDCLDDGNLCNGIPACVGGQCTTDPGTEITCIDDGGNPCSTQVCVPESGQCITQFLETGSGCNDENPCTSGDICLDGVCSGVTVVCDDGNPCTSDTCDTGSGCVTAPIAGTCDDGNQCTTGDKCLDGKCVSNGTLECSDNNLCTTDNCFPAVGCQFSFALGSCNDDDPCTVQDACKQGVCTGSAVVCEPTDDTCQSNTCNPDTGNCELSSLSCNDANACTADSCDPNGECIHETLPCDDGDKCTEDICTADAGCQSTAITCKDEDPCTTDTCDPATGNCVNETLVCDDQNSCTNDLCTDSGCVFEAVTCDDGNPCTEDKCSDGSCVSEAITCNDGDSCTENICDGGNCFNPAVECTDGNACTQDLCKPESGCEHPPVDCDDNIDCSIDTCEEEAGCQHEPQSALCDDENQCTEDICDKTGGCSNPALEGYACDDGDPCTGGDICVGASCNAGSDILCGPCEGLGNGASCTDGNEATVGDICLDGVCAGFTTFVVHPTGADKNSRFDHIMFTQGYFYATGTDETGILNTQRAWIAQLTAEETSIVSNTIEYNDSYTALTDGLAVTDDGVIYSLSDEDWTDSGDVATAFQNTGSISPSNLEAAWGGPHEDGSIYYLSGRSNNESWIVLCDSEEDDGCTKETVSYNYFSIVERPRALFGWGLSTGDDKQTVESIILSDYPGTTGGGQYFYYNDAHVHSSLDSQQPWELTYFDEGGSSRRSKDVHGANANDVWWVGTDGLLRHRSAGPTGQADWSYLPNVLSDQGSIDMHGVWASSDVALIAASQPISNDRQLSIITHDGSASDQDGWSVIPLMYVEKPGFFNSNTIIAGLEDIWVHDGLVVAVGWRYYQEIGQFRGLIFARFLP